MADTDVLLGIDFDTKDAVSTAKNLGKEVNEIFKQDSGTKNTAILNLDNQMKSGVVSADKLVRKLESLKDVQVPTEAYSKLQKELESLRVENDKYYAKAEELSEVGHKYEQLKDTVAQYKEKIDELSNSTNLTVEQTGELAELTKKLAEAEKEMQSISKKGMQWEKITDEVIRTDDAMHNIGNKMQDLVKEGKAFQLGQDTEEFKKTERELGNINSKLNVQLIKHRQIEDKIKGMPATVDRIKKSWLAIGGIVAGLNSKINSIVGKWKNATKQVIAHRKQIDRTNLSLTGLVKKLLMYGLGFHGLFSLIGKLRSVLTQGFEDVYASKQLTGLNDKIDELKASLATLRNAFVGAFAPIVEMVIPYLQRLVEWLTKAVGMVAQFIAALTGKSTYLRAIKQRKKAIGEEKDELEDENEALEEQQRQLSGLDKLNVLNSPRTPKATNKDKKKKAEEEAVGPLFEEVPIDSKIKEWAEKIKRMLKDLIYPIKEAWNRMGKFVIDSWKKAFESLKQLGKSVWRDFIDVWKQEATIKIFEDIFKIIGDIGLFISIIADKIREAWDYEGTGKAILEAIRNIIGVIVKYIRLAADYTVEWAKELDFRPLFKKIKEWLESLEKPVQSIMGILYDFYRNVILKFVKFMINDDNGLQRLLKVFIDFNKKIEWDKLRNRLNDFWKALEPFIEKAWEGFVIFIERIANAVANFINSKEFGDFLDKVKEWMSKVSAEDIANTLETLAKAIIAIKLASVGFKIVSTVTSILSTLSKLGPALLLILKPFKLLGKGLLNLGSILIQSLDLKLIGKALLGGFKDVGLLIGKGFKSLSSIALKGAAELGKGFLTMNLGDLGASFAAGGTTAAATFMTSFFAAVTAAIAGWNIGQQIDQKLNGDEGMGTFKEQMQGIKESFSDGSWKDALKLWGEDIKWAWSEILGINQESNQQMLQDNEETAALMTFQEAYNREHSLSIWTQFKEGLIAIVQETKENIKAKWTEIKQSVSGKVLEIKTDIQAKFAEMKANIFGKMAEIKQNWINGWNLIKSKVQSVVATIKGLVGSLMSWVNSKIASMKSAWDGAVQKFSQTPIGRAVSGVKNFFKAPPAATGAVIPPQMSQRVFTVGDNNSETEVISPLSTMKQAMIEALQQANIGNNSGGGDIVVQIDGREVFRAVKTQATQYSNQHGGRSAFAGA